jgi:predicted  nucleic acid-binding Zn-ribbon protein
MKPSEKIQEQIKQAEADLASLQARMGKIEKRLAWLAGQKDSLELLVEQGDPEGLRQNDQVESELATLNSAHGALRGEIEAQLEAAGKLQDDYRRAVIAETWEERDACEVQYLYHIIGEHTKLVEAQEERTTANLAKRQVVELEAKLTAMGIKPAGISEPICESAKLIALTQARLAELRAKYSWA